MTTAAFIAPGSLPISRVAYCPRITAQFDLSVRSAAEEACL
jgi:hypothetical protein